MGSVKPVGGVVANQWDWLNEKDDETSAGREELNVLEDKRHVE